jgi:hypothetical protein
MKNFFLSLWFKYKSWQYERKCLKYFGAKPETIYVSAEDYDSLVKRLNEPPDPEAMERIKKIMERLPPWKD